MVTLTKGDSSKFKSRMHARIAASKEARRRERAEEQKVDDLRLPKEKKAIVTDFRRYTMLLYGRPKIGKTTWLSTWEDVLFFATEPGTAGQEIFEFNANDGGVRNWHIALKGAELLERSDRFRNVVVDTADELFSHCVEHVCKEMGIKGLGLTPEGESDWGRSYREVRKQFAALLYRIKRTGRGLMLTAHAREREIKAKSGEKYDIIEPTLSKSAGEIVLPLVDFIFFADYMRDEKGKTVRVVVTHGDDTITAGHRAGDFPRYFAPGRLHAARTFQRAFSGEEKGLDPETLLPARQSAKATRKLLLSTGEGD